MQDVLSSPFSVFPIIHTVSPPAMQDMRSRDVEKVRSAIRYRPPVHIIILWVVFFDLLLIPLTHSQAEVFVVFQ
jgi:hypothetical protein